ncbi:MAG: recombinase family protein [Gammaproteobacteria bacterium]|nr:recombinase family protein [Gammaproteobacteria bacterium]
MQTPVQEDRTSGSNTDRLKLRECLAGLVAGDCLVVWRLDRLGRSLADLIRIVAQLEERGIGLESIMERIDTVSPAGRFMFHVLGALAEFERNLIRERILAGLAAARARGRRIGRPRKVSRDLARRLRRLVRQSGMTVAQAARRLGVSRATAFRVLSLPEKIDAKCLWGNKKTDSYLEKICFRD